MKVYEETFESGPGGWYGFQDAPGQRKRQLEWQPGRLTSRSPWWIDYNHAPPGAGHLHMLFCVFTRGPIAEHYGEVGGENAFVSGEFGTDFTDAKFTIRLKGEIDGDMHLLRPEKDYPVWRSRLPEGYVMLDTVRIEFAVHSQAAIAPTEGPDHRAAIGDQQGHCPKEANR